MKIILQKLIRCNYLESISWDLFIFGKLCGNLKENQNIVQGLMNYFLIIIGFKS
jgi:hypothetical protein